MSKSSNPQSRFRRRRVIGRDERASEAVVKAVATASNVAPTDLPPLAERIDPGWLNESVADRDPSPAAGLIFTRDADIPTEFETRFRYAGYDVTVTESYVALERAASREPVRR